MTCTTWESLKGDTQSLVSRLKELIHEGNVRRLIVRHDGKTIMEIPLMIAAVGVLAAPLLAAIGALAALAFAAYASRYPMADHYRTAPQEERD